MRSLIAFGCEGATLIGTLDMPEEQGAPGTTGLLIVSGGNEVRAGAHRGMALLAGRLAAVGVPVFRFDRRGVGDSDGDNRGYASAAADLAAAVAAFRAEAPHVTRLVGFGNCDAATTLALFGADAGIDAVVLANPWVVERAAGDLPAPAAVRAHYGRKLASPREWVRLVGGGVDLTRLARGLARLFASPADDLVRRVAAALAGREASVVLATGDATAIAYADAARRVGLSLPTLGIESASHSFAGPGDAAALEAAIISLLSSPRT
jgi:exosortase A-associated hydrolase 1